MIYPLLYCSQAVYSSIPLWFIGGRHLILLSQNECLMWDASVGHCWYNDIVPKLHPVGFHLKDEYKLQLLSCNCSWWHGQIVRSLFCRFSFVIGVVRHLLIKTKLRNNTKPQLSPFNRVHVSARCCCGVSPTFWPFNVIDVLIQSRNGEKADDDEEPCRKDICRPALEKLLSVFGSSNIISFKLGHSGLQAVK